MQNQKLTPNIRALIVGAAVDGQNYRDISARFNVSISTVSRKKNSANEPILKLKSGPLISGLLQIPRNDRQFKQLKKPLKSHNFRPEKKSRHCRFHINDYSIFKKSKPAKKRSKKRLCID